VRAQGDPPIQTAQNNQKSKAAEKDDGDGVGHGIGAAKNREDGEAKEIKEEETDREIRWLEAEWESLAEILRQMDLEIH